ncbi:MAG: flavin reductase family protein [Lachnospiraceae bacterium]|nr:flavin reductase family protein [Lachnospiraceae bacterium]
MSKQIWKGGNMLNPVPAVMVTCQRPGEKPNIITVAWTGTVCSNPPMLYVSIRPERYSHGIISDTKEFVVNLVSSSMIRACDWCGVKSGRDCDKFKETGLTPIPSANVNAPTIDESPLSLECKVTDIIKLGSHDMFLAEIVSVAADERYCDENGRFSMDKADLTAYCHGEYYALGEKLGSFGYSVKKKKRKK